jgi:hypothetical protein
MLKNEELLLSIYFLKDGLNAPKTKETFKIQKK